LIVIPTLWDVCWSKRAENGLDDVVEVVELAPDVGSG
jgi:hypothetical protein